MAVIECTPRRVTRMLRSRVGGDEGRRTVETIHSSHSVGQYGFSQCRRGQPGSVCLYSDLRLSVSGRLLFRYCISIVRTGGVGFRYQSLDCIE